MSAAKEPRRQERQRQPERETRRRKERGQKAVESLSIHKVLKQAYPDTGVSSKAMSMMNSFFYDMFESITAEASRLAH